MRNMTSLTVTAAAATAAAAAEMSNGQRQRETVGESMKRREEDKLLIEVIERGTRTRRHTDTQNVACREAGG